MVSYKAIRKLISFSPHLLVYSSDTQPEVIKKFAEIIKVLNKENEQFRNSSKPI